MPERDLVATALLRNAVKNAATQAGAERADVLPFGDQTLNDRISVLIFDVIGHARRGQPRGERFAGKGGDVLVDVDGFEFEANRCSLLQNA